MTRLGKLAAVAAMIAGAAVAAIGAGGADPADALTPSECQVLTPVLLQAIAGEAQHLQAASALDFVALLQDAPADQIAAVEALSAARTAFVDAGDAFIAALQQLAQVIAQCGGKA